MAAPTVGALLRDWRSRRHLSQMELAHQVGVSTRHLSFVETGRSRPSPEVVEALARGLDLSLRDRNELLLAAGFAPRYSETSLDDPTMAAAKAAVQRLLDTHDPYPGVIIDRAWNIVATNRSALVLVEGLPDHVLGPELNVFRVCLHPDGLSTRTRNLAEWGGYLLHELQRLCRAAPEPALQALHDEVLGYPDVQALLADPPEPEQPPPLLIPLRLDVGSTELSFFITLTTFGTPRDITLDELAVELFFPADERTATILRGT